ncbi:DUF551 domain-containing protein [Salmonella enterica subsp. enterica]|nr:DUF551 domain-containing protein [Salmonella enterica subsp. enterica]
MVAVAERGRDLKDAPESVEAAANLKLAEIALASLTAAPVRYLNKFSGTCVTLEQQSNAADDVAVYMPLYAAQPAPVVPDEMATSDDMNLYQKSFAQGYNACRAAMLQGAEPVSQTYELPEIIEGMEVSIDVSTCDADAGNRYFGTVTEVSELDTAKNGYILLVQDAKPNFDVNGNSPVIPGGWISCSERIPVIGELNWRTSFPLLVTCEIGVIPAYYGFVRVNGNKHYGFMESLKYGDDSGNHPQTNEYDLISNVTHWMPLPEPPQEVNRG